MVSPWAARELLLWCLKYLFTSFFTDIGWDCFSYLIFLAPHCHAEFCSLSFSPRHFHLGCWVQPCPTAGPLEPSGTSCVWRGAALVSPHRGCPAAPATNTWAPALSKTVEILQDFLRVFLSLVYDFGPSNMHGNISELLFTSGKHLVLANLLILSNVSLNIFFFFFNDSGTYKLTSL